MEPTQSESKARKANSRHGYNTFGHTYHNVNEMWAEELKYGRDLWYGLANQYWDRADATISGVLGGFPEIHEPDVVDSNELLSSTFSGSRPTNRCLD
jgi:hypothetical protein